MTTKKIWLQEELTCKPLDTYDEILEFLQNPPSWRSLTIPLKPHSEEAIRNIDINKNFGEPLLESPQSFCHYNPETEEPERQDRKKLPKTLVCHDMANGYHDDSIIDGTGNFEAYTFYNWAGIDIFCYFSHRLITIPPLGWINVGHAHGVKVIGTVITEWGEGVNFWDKVLASEREWKNFASALVTIAKTLKFDGWLLNVENKIAKPNVLLEFVRHFHTILHQELEEPELIWYDSVTIDGHLNWQNGLNSKNKAFFDVVDGFFTNYSWTEKNIERSVAAASDRLTDLYIGMDVWGRNFYGGGQFNTQKAVQVAHSYGCSLAIFAPAWTHEAMSDNTGDINAIAESESLTKYEKFILRDRALWCSIWPFLNTRLPSTLPFQTSFCRGQGKKRRLYGEVICPLPWYNLRHMHYQLNSSLGSHGYLLSTQDNILNLSRLGLLKNKAGILRYRRSIEASRLELYSESNKEVTIQLNDSLSEFRDVEDNDVQEAEPSDDRKTVKRKMKNVFRNIFRTKSKKKETDEDKIDDSIPSTNDLNSSGQSMVQMSVNLRLGNKTEKTRYALAYVPEELECFEQFYEDSFLGGSCLKINPSDEVDEQHRLLRLYYCNFHCQNSLIACVVTKNLVGYESQFLNIKMYITDRDENCLEAILIGRDIPHSTQSVSQASGTMNLYPLDHTGQEFRNVQKYLLLNEPGFYTSIENPYDWHVRYYEINIPEAHVTSIYCRTGLQKGPILLGYFGLCHKKE